MAKYDPNRSMLFWWMGNIEGGGEYYQVMIVRDNQVAIQIDKATDEPFQWPASVAPGLKHELARDGWRVVEDDGDHKHFAALGDIHRFWTCRQLAWLVGKLIPESGKVRVIKSSLG
jgi:hypothetical protein